MDTVTAPLRRGTFRPRIPEDLKRGVLIGVGGAAAGLLAGQLVLGGHFAAVFGLIGLFVPVAMWRKPEISPVVMLGCALLIEQFSAGVSAYSANAPSAANAALSPQIPITGSIPFFQGLGSLHLDPSDLLLIFVFILVMFRVSWSGPIPWPRSYVSVGVKALFGCLLLGLVIGAMHHFNSRMAFQESRPYVYLASAYFLTAVLIRSRSALQWMLWTIVIAETIKSIQGVVVYVGTRSWAVPPESVLGHEEAYFFSIYMLLVATLWMFSVKGRLRTVSTSLLPLIIFADLVNDRRAAWLVLGGGLLVLFATGYVAIPERRPALKRVGLVALLVSAVYLPVYWNKGGNLAQPARALKSAFSPDPRDQASDLYREQENINLEYNIAQGGLIGKGFGIPIDYALPIVNIQAIDPDILYIPHNGVLYVLMRMGILGAVAQWCMIGFGIVAGCRLAKSGDKQVAVIGTLVACALVGYALEGATDQGFYFYRIAFVTGALLGLTESARYVLAQRASPAEWPKGRDLRV
jgi:hypothetical protein